MTTFDPLWPAFQQALREPPGDLATAIGALPEVGCLPSPWLTWTLIGLVRHRRRQLWVAEIVATKLGGHLEAIAAMGAFGHPPDIPQRGLVPGLIEWEYYFHGKGCCMTHRGSFEAIDVDFFGPNGEYFDVFFFLCYLKSLRNPEPPKARLISLHRSSEPVRLAVRELLDDGMLDPLEGREEYPFRVSEQVLDHQDAIHAFCETWGNPDRWVWLAALVGDWLAAHELALDSGDQRLIDLTAGRTATCRALRVQGLWATRRDEDRRGDFLLALDELDAEMKGGTLKGYRPVAK